MFFTASSALTWKSTRISALRGLGRRFPTLPLSQGEIVETAGSVRSLRISAGP